MMRSNHRALAACLAVALSVAIAAPALGQDEAMPTTISKIAAGEVAGVVQLEGAVLERLDDEEYLFSDGTGVISIDIDTSTADTDLPLFTLIGIEGSVASDEIDVRRWEPLRIFTPAVIVSEPQVIEAFQGWIVAYGSQATE
jgi:uncharacterized protein YdeI (BOF family)